MFVIFLFNCRLFLSIFPHCTSRAKRKPVIGVCHKVSHKSVCTATKDGQRLEISDLESRGLYYLCRKIKDPDQLRSCCAAESASLFFAYAKRRLSHDVANMTLKHEITVNLKTTTKHHVSVVCLEMSSKANVFIIFFSFCSLLFSDCNIKIHIAK